MKIKNVRNCIFSAWYFKFIDLTIESVVIPLPKDILDYLLDDGCLLLPHSSAADTSACDNEADGDNDDADDDEDWDSENLSDADLPHYPEFDEQISSAITDLGGAVFPKLNWSSPKDASWIAFGNTLKCKTPSDIYLLLKSSDFVTHDLTQPFLQCDDVDSSEDTKLNFELVLRKWVELNPGLEFRCFIKNDQIIGISQRHDTNFFDFIDSMKEEICQDILEFYQSKIEGKFTDQNYVMDVYRCNKNSVWLIDFNPFGAVTDSLLFTWEELLEKQPMTHNVDVTSEDVCLVLDFRFVGQDPGMQANPYRQYGLPRDVYEFSGPQNTSDIVEFLKYATVDSDSDEE